MHVPTLLIAAYLTMALTLVAAAPFAFGRPASKGVGCGVRSLRHAGLVPPRPPRGAYKPPFQTTGRRRLSPLAFAAEGTAGERKRARASFIRPTVPISTCGTSVASAAPAHRAFPSSSSSRSSSALFMLRSFASDAYPLLQHRIQAIVDSNHPIGQSRNSVGNDMASPTMTSRQRNSASAAAVSQSMPSISVKQRTSSTALSMLRREQMSASTATATKVAPVQINSAYQTLMPTPSPSPSPTHLPPHSQPKRTATNLSFALDSFSQPSVSKLTTTGVRRLRVNELRTQLSLRGLDTSGNRPALLTRLLAAVESHDDWNGDEQNDEMEVQLDTIVDRSSIVSEDDVPQFDVDEMMRLYDQKNSINSDSVDSGPRTGDADEDMANDDARNHDNDGTNDDEQEHDGSQGGGFRIFFPSDSLKFNTRDGAHSNNEASISNKPFVVDESATYTLRVRGYTTRKSGGVGIGMSVSTRGEEKSPLWAGQMYVPGDRTMFEAEYSALWLGLDYATTILGIKSLGVQIDNEIVVGQIDGIFKISRESLQTLFKLVQIQIEAKMDSGVIRNYEGIERIRPSENELVGRLARKAFAQRKTMLDRFDEWKFKDPVDVVVMSEERPTQSEGGKWADTDEEAKPNNDIDTTDFYTLQFDGGSRGNPGIAGAGMVIYNHKGEEIWCGWKYHDSPTTNNVAEYLGLLCGLQCAASLGIKHLKVEGDSQLIVRQLNGRYRCKEKKLKEYYDACKKLILEFEKTEIHHIPRAQNSRADWLANHAMDLRESDGFTPVPATQEGE